MGKQSIIVAGVQLGVIRTNQYPGLPPLPRKKATIPRTRTALDAVPPVRRENAYLPVEPESLPVWPPLPPEDEPPDEELPEEALPSDDEPEVPAPALGFFDADECFFLCVRFACDLPEVPLLPELIWLLSCWRDWISRACCSTSAARAGSVLMRISDDGDAVPLPCAWPSPANASKETKSAADVFFIVTSVDQSMKQLVRLLRIRTARICFGFANFQKFG